MRHASRRVPTNGSRNAVDELVDQDVIADLQGRQHRPGRNLERLDDEGADEQRQHQRHREGFGVLAQDRFAARPEPARRFRLGVRLQRRGRLERQ